MPDRFSPADHPSAFLWHKDGAVLVGNAPLPETQFRQVPGKAGDGTISLEPITAPGRLLARAPDGSAVFADAGTASPGECSFRRRVRAAGGGMTFALAGGNEQYLHHADGRARIGEPGLGMASATFLLS